MFPRNTFSLKLRYKKSNEQIINIIGREIKNPLYKTIEKIKSIYKPACKFIPSNILKAFTKSKIHKTVKYIEKPAVGKWYSKNEKF